jgi:hypothetical protein
MPTMKDICNQGLGKLGASRVNNLSPPISTLEVKCASEYPQWKASELKKKRWVFATTLLRVSALTTQVAADTDGRTYQFQKPGDFLRGIRPKNCTWVERGQFLYDYGNYINLEYIRLVPDNELTDPCFVDVLAARVAVECAELASQSSAKKRDALFFLKDAEDEAGRLNAFVLDPHETEGDDRAFTWDNARANPSWSGM